jgi:hypothetical protein
MAHLEAPGVIDLRITRAGWSRVREDFGDDPAVRRDPSRRDWIELHLRCEADLDRLAVLLMVAMAANALLVNSVWPMRYLRQKRTLFTKGRGAQICGHATSSSRHDRAVTPGRPVVARRPDRPVLRASSDRRCRSRGRAPGLARSGSTPGTSTWAEYGTTAWTSSSPSTPGTGLRTPPRPRHRPENPARQHAGQRLRSLTQPGGSGRSSSTGVTWPAGADGYRNGPGAERST